MEQAHSTDGCMEVQLVSGDERAYNRSEILLVIEENLVPVDSLAIVSPRPFN